MKYLHDDRLAELTQDLTDRQVGGSVSQRILNGRLEAYTMKRGSDDKKYAFKLGEKFVASLENLAEDASVLQKRASKATATTRKRSQSAGVFQESGIASKQIKTQRGRASSFDTTRLPPISSWEPLAVLPPRSSSAPGIVPSALGDFAAQGTRRLMTDLILTLNMSFPDFDFGDVQPTEFVHLPGPTAVHSINKRLSDVALLQETFLADLWSSIHAVINLAECEVYSYQPQDGELMSFLTQTLTEGSIVLGGGEDASPTPTNNEKPTSESSLVSEQPPTTIWSFNYFFVNKSSKRILLFTCVESMRGFVDAEEDDGDVNVVPSIMVDAAEEDFDLDPADSPAGGIPVSIM